MMKVIVSGDRKKRRYQVGLTSGVMISSLTRHTRRVNMEIGFPELDESDYSVFARATRQVDEWSKEGDDVVTAIMHCVHGKKPDCRLRTMVKIQPSSSRPGAVVSSSHSQFIDLLAMTVDLSSERHSFEVESRIQEILSRAAVLA